MRKIISILLFIAACGFANSQGINNLWLLGYGYPQFGGGKMSIDFKYGFDSIYSTQRQMHFATTNANISDSNGNLLFYTNGYYIANALGDTMLNGNNLVHNIWTQLDTIGEYSEQGALILPMPGDPNKYYLFHAPWEGQLQDDWFYSIIDMAQDGGLGAVVSQNNVLVHDSVVRGKITACKHANGRDWWVIFPRFNSQIYYEFLVTPYGILGPYMQNPGGAIRSSGGVGQSCFSPDGNKYAYYDPNSDLDNFDFDRCSGLLSNLIHVDIYDSADIGGVAFSPSSRLLYVSSNTFVYQFDLAAADVPASQTIVAVWDTFYSPSPPFAATFYLAWLAPDEKIYIICGNSTVDLHRINSPDSVGLACDFEQHSVHLPTYNAFTIPQNVNYFLAADSSSVVCDSINAISRDPQAFNQNVEIFPSPASDLLYVRSICKGERGSIYLFNVLGKKVESGIRHFENGEFIEIRVSDLSPGVYYLQLQNSSQSLVREFIKE
ncbi:MAG: T9SS type A sorting domain-containing protein [Bacteroidota bacterium]